MANRWQGDVFVLLVYNLRHFHLWVILSTVPLLLLFTTTSTVQCDIIFSGLHLQPLYHFVAVLVQNRFLLVAVHTPPLQTIWPVTTSSSSISLFSLHFRLLPRLVSLLQLFEARLAIVSWIRLLVHLKTWPGCSTTLNNSAAYFVHILSIHLYL